MANREWFLMKILGTTLSLVMIISICIGGANILFDVKRDVVRVEKNIDAHEVTDTKNWDKVWADVEANEDKIQLIQIQNERLETNQREMLREVGLMKSMLIEMTALMRTFERDE